MSRRPSHLSSGLQDISSPVPCPALLIQHHGQLHKSDPKLRLMVPLPCLDLPMAECCAAFKASGPHPCPHPCPHPSPPPPLLLAAWPACSSGLSSDGLGPLFVPFPSLRASVPLTPPHGSLAHRPGPPSHDPREPWFPPPMPTLRGLAGIKRGQAPKVLSVVGCHFCREPCTSAKGQELRVMSGPEKVLRHVTESYLKTVSPPCSVCLFERVLAFWMCIRIFIF